MVCSKFDKLDKIFTCFVLIIVTFFCVLNNICFAYNTDIVENIVVRYVGLENAEFAENPNYVCFTFKVKKGVKYTIKSSQVFSSYPPGNIATYSSDIPKVGDKPFFSSYQGNVFDKKNGVSFIAKYDGYYSYIYNEKDTFKVDYLSVSQDTSYMSAAVNDLSLSVGSLDIWSVFEKNLPYVLVVVLFAFGIYLITRMIKGLSKGKGRL